MTGFIEHLIFSIENVENELEQDLIDSLISKCSEDDEVLFE